jgi:ABC-type transport system involved in Fe-S cluster assembly fused permease/ATPase subunit
VKENKKHGNNREDKAFEYILCGAVIRLMTPMYKQASEQHARKECGKLSRDSAKGKKDIQFVLQVPTLLWRANTCASPNQ